MSAQIHDVGYREYEGERAGVAWAMWSLGIHAAQRVLGLKRTARHKILPAIIIFIAFVPAIVFVGMAAFVPSVVVDADEVDYGGYLGLIVVVILLFAAFVGPEAICTDRRTGMFALYLASPLNRTTYLVSKIGAVAATILTVTLLPLLFLLVGYTIEGVGPDGPVEFAETLVRISAAGSLVAVYFATFGAMVSSFSPRRSLASAAMVLTFLIPTIVSAVLIEVGDARDEVDLINVAFLPLRSAFYLLGQETSSGEPGLEAVDGSLALLATTTVIAMSTALTWWRYQRLEVGR